MWAVEVLMSDHIVLTPKYDGWVGLMAYNRMGGSRSMVSLSTLRKR